MTLQNLKGRVVGNADRKLRAMFLCTGNSCRSQMAEGWAKHMKAGQIEAYSAGIEPYGPNPLAVRAMGEVGIDISGHTSKRPEDIGVEFDYVVTVCDSAHESCPIFPARTHVIHVGFLLGLAGGIASYVLGTVLAVTLGPRLANIVVLPMPVLMFWALGISVLIALAASYFPARRAARLDPCATLQEV